MLINLNNLIKMTTLWDDPEIKKSFDRLDTESKYQCHTIGKFIYGDHNLVENKNADSTAFDIATQIDLMLRDGLFVEMLTETEKEIFVNVFGLSKLEEYM